MLSKIIVPLLAFAHVHAQSTASDDKVMDFVVDKVLDKLLGRILLQKQAPTMTRATPLLARAAGTVASRPVAPPPPAQATPAATGSDAKEARQWISAFLARQAQRSVSAGAGAAEGLQADPSDRRDWISSWKGKQTAVRESTKPAAAAPPAEAPPAPAAPTNVEGLQADADDRRAWIAKWRESQAEAPAPAAASSAVPSSAAETMTDADGVKVMTKPDGTKVYIFPNA